MSAELPVGMDDVAVELGCSRRTLTTLLGRYPHYSQPGKRKVFYRTDIDALKAAICKKRGEVYVPPRPTWQQAIDILEAARPKTPRSETLRAGVKSYEHNKRMYQAAAKHRCVIYFIAAGDKVKIGLATNLPLRVTNMQPGSPDQLVVLGFTPGGVEQERGIHNQFQADHYRGEWFYLTKSIMSFIEGLPQ